MIALGIKILTSTVAVWLGTSVVGNIYQGHEVTRNKIIIFAVAAALAWNL